MSTDPIQDIWDEKNAFNFDRLLEPYRQGGTESAPVTRTIGIIIDWLINKKKYPVDVVGAAIMIVFWEMHKGKEFLGKSNAWGSKGDELDNYIRVTCDHLLQNKLQDQVFASIAGGRMAMINEFINKEVLIRTYPWYKKLFLRKRWKTIKAEYERLIEGGKSEPA
jgi:hypothetical protein